MKLVRPLAIALVLFTAACSKDPVGPPPRITALPRALTSQESQLIQADNRFAIKLLKQATADTRDTLKNLFVSPLSVAMALAMTYNGAAGTTEDSMRATLELDATGTPIAGAFFFATPREWARLGLLFLDDGVVGGTRILPEGWVRYSTTATPGAFVGYGAGWWINHDESRGARFRREHGMPAEAFMAMGIYGQTVVVVPSARLVIARFGTTYDLQQAMIDICRLTASTIAALPAAR